MGRPPTAVLPAACHELPQPRFLNPVPSRAHSTATGPEKSPPRPQRIVVAITGATGTLFGLRLLKVLRGLGIETHLVLSKWAMATMKYETEVSEREVREMASHCYAIKDLSAPPSSGSFLHDGMIIVPCSMKTLAAVRTGFCDDLISRAADVTLKERRKLMLVVRETPLSSIHLDNMLELSRAGAIVFPPVPAFYSRPESIQELVDQSVGRMLDSFGIHCDDFPRWQGFEWNETKRK
ncbi:Phenylacrylic acid decarboxylase [Aspergillus heteromorphus CBS 117.55]|uniref:Flavin prenyltransferase PAD1, mitochondrial n=1 Tax=Aspergillus heteromorphus CBS 117.55 TaxID=1448321 RepID=A0A317WNX0_9EURO|nr:Phenylacrylic acid decarboxylase [Aspergillus heteromorphus CBS 117.55]PWY88179.1 Phenylacrylic acid decarboxylase [Aspergillus heteromorphus CBS 117.55]